MAEKKRTTHARGIAELAPAKSYDAEPQIPPPGQDPAFDAWFAAEVRKGAESGRRDGYITHADVLAWFRARARGKVPARPKPR